MKIVALQIDADARIGRILSNELDLREVGTCTRKTNRARTLCAGNVGQGAFIITNESGIQPACFPRLPVIIPVHAEVQRQVGTELPIVLEIGADFALVLLVILVRHHGRTG